MLTTNTTRPLLLGPLAVYASDIETACLVYAKVMSGTKDRTFGTVTLESGEEVDWVDMGRGVVPPGEEQ